MLEGQGKERNLVVPCLTPCRPSAPGHLHFAVVRENMKLGAMVSLLAEGHSLPEDLRKNGLYLVTPRTASDST